MTGWPPITAPGGTPPRQHPAEALNALADQLRHRGLTHIYTASCSALGVLSLPSIAVWTNGRLLWWRTSDIETTWPAADAYGAARQLVEL